MQLLVAAVRPPLGLVGNGGASWRQRLASVEANLRIEDMLVCRGGAGLVGSFLCQEDGETNRRWQGLPPLVFLAEANERLIWVYEGESERGAVRGCLGSLLLFQGQRGEGGCSFFQ